MGTPVILPPSAPSDRSPASNMLPLIMKLAVILGNICQNADQRLITRVDWGECGGFNYTRTIAGGRMEIKTSSSCQGWKSKPWANHSPWMNAAIWSYVEWPRQELCVSRVCTIRQPPPVHLADVESDFCNALLSSILSVYGISHIIR